MKVPRMRRTERRWMINLGRRSGDPHTAMRFQAVARLGLGRSSVQVAVELDMSQGDPGDPRATDRGPYVSFDDTSFVT